MADMEADNMAREMTPQERAAAFVQAWMKQSTYTTESFINDVLEHDKETRRAALLEVRQLCVDYEDCCVLALVAHADKAVTNASISTMQFIKRHIDDRLAQEG